MPAPSCCGPTSRKHERQHCCILYEHDCQADCQNHGVRERNFYGFRPECVKRAWIGHVSVNFKINPDRHSIEVMGFAGWVRYDCFRGEFGADIFRSPDVAFTKIGVAIAGFEGTTQLQLFSSEYDQFIQGKTVLFDNEKRGMLFFIDKMRAIASAVLP